MSLRSKLFALIGELCLEKAILGVLRREQRAGKCIGPADISKRAGIFREKGDDYVMNDAVVMGMLTKLCKKRKVQRCTQPSGQGGWELAL